MPPRKNSRKALKRSHKRIWYYFLSPLFDWRSFNFRKNRAIKIERMLWRFYTCGQSTRIHSFDLRTARNEQVCKMLLKRYPVALSWQRKIAILVTTISHTLMFSCIAQFMRCALDTLLWLLRNLFKYRRNKLRKRGSETDQSKKARLLSSYLSNAHYSFIALLY